MAVKDFIKGIRKQISSNSAVESETMKVTDFISTGSYALNRILSGSVYKGVPEGRIVMWAGPSGSGKSLIVSQIIKNALNEKNYDVVFYVDSEGGILSDLLEKSVDLDKVEYVQVATTEECAIKLLKIYQGIEDAQKSGEKVKALVVLDSLGALVPEKTILDATKKDQMVQDMGTGARLKNSMMASLMMRVVKTNCALMVINHIYENPGALFTSKIKNVSGGLKAQYSSHIIVQTAKKLIKSNDGDFGTNEQNEARDSGDFFKGNNLTFFTTKNRIVKPGLEASVYIDFDNGISKYDGLIDDAIKYGFIVQEGRKYSVPSYSTEKKFYWNDLLINDDLWNSFLPEFDKKSQEMLSYSSRNSISDEELEKLESSEN